MTVEADVRTQPDKIAVLLEQISTGKAAARDMAARGLLLEVHRAIFPMCVKMLGNQDDAYEAEAETMARLLAHLNRTNADADPIANATAYVRTIARNVCTDLTTASRRRRADRSVDDLDEDQRPAVQDYASTMLTPAAAPTGVQQKLITTFGYTSKRVLADLQCLSPQELNVVILRQEGFEYRDIATMLKINESNASQRGARGLRKLRGLAHVGVWREDRLDTWPVPACEELAALKAQVQQLLQADQPVTAKLYMEIGEHLDIKGCSECVEERKRSRRAYWWLLILLIPFTPNEQQPATQPTALDLDIAAVGALPQPLDDPAVAAEVLGVSRRRLDRRQLVLPGVIAALVLLLLLGAGITGARADHTDQHAASQDQGAAGGPTQATSASTTSATSPGTSAAPVPEPNISTLGPAAGTSTPPVSTPNPGSGNSTDPGTGSDPGQDTTGNTGPAAAPPVVPPPPAALPPDPCANPPSGTSTAFVNSGSKVCWRSGGRWRELDMGSLRATPQTLGPIPVPAGTALFLTATDSAATGQGAWPYVYSTLVDSAGNNHGWSRLFDRFDHYWSGFNLDAAQPVTAAPASSAVRLYAVGLDHMIWTTTVSDTTLTDRNGWFILNDRTRPDGGRFVMPSTIRTIGPGEPDGYAPDGVYYRGCYPNDSNQFRWIPDWMACPPYIPGPR